MKYDFKNNRELIRKTAKRYHMSMNKARIDFKRTQRFEHFARNNGIPSTDVIIITRTKAVQLSENLLDAVARNRGRVVFDEFDLENLIMNGNKKTYDSPVIMTKP